MGSFEAFGRYYKAVWARLSAGHRIILLLLCFISVGGMATVVFWAGRPDFEILYTDLSAKECASLICALKDAGIPVRTAQGGSAVMVASSKIHEARMVGAEKGMPSHARNGFDAFRDPKIGMTPFAERINFISALQSELATTITSLDSVVYARVHLVVPERALFKADRDGGSASVLVATRGGHRLRREEAMAITNLVASAVEGLSPGNVTITDGRGNVLAGADQDGPEMAADDQFAYRQEVEAYLSSKAETMLASVLGRGRAQVRVSAEIDFKDTRETTHTYDPDKKALRSEQIESTQTTGSGMQAGGVVGSSANVPGEGGGPASLVAAPQQSTTESINTEYSVSETMTESITRGAYIKRLTVAAFIDFPTAAEGEEALLLPTSEQVTQLISDAVGLDTSRGDSLNIVESDFYPATAELADVGGGPPAWVMTLAEYSAVGVLGLVLFLIARRVLKGIESAAPRRVLVPDVLGVEGEGLPVQVHQDELMRREIARFVEASPEAAGRMLEGWVEGEE